MEKERLKNLRSLKVESEQIAKKIEDIKGQHDSQQKGNLVADRYIETMRKKRETLDAEILEMETWLNQIGSARTRTILRMYFQDGKSQKTIGEELFMEQSTISKIINGILRE